ncbi:PDZ domain-containing protein, partial [Dialister invisus]
QWDHESGILVMKVAKNSPLSLTDVRVGDYILSIDGKTVDTVKGMREIIDAHKPGDKISLQYEHNGRSETTEILLSSVSESDQ